MATKAILKEQIIRILSGGNPSDRMRFRDADIERAISDVSNQLLKAEVVTSLAANPLYNVDSLSVVTYENLPVSRGVNWDKTKTATLKMPAKPFMLENGLGVQAVYPSGMPHLFYYYIPESMFSSWAKNRYVAPLQKRFFTYSGSNIVIYDDLFSSGIGASVDLKLVISDISSVGENDPLPILPEHIDTIIGAVVKRFAETPDTNRRETDQLSPSQRN